MAQTRKSGALGQSYIVDLTAELDLKKSGASDNLDDTVSYTQLYRAVQAVLEGESRNLLEATAQAIADKVLADFPVNAVRGVFKKAAPADTRLGDRYCCCRNLQGPGG